MSGMPTPRAGWIDDKMAHMILPGGSAPEADGTQMKPDERFTEKSAAAPVTMG
jgi:hypothetical protein